MLLLERQSNAMKQVWDSLRAFSIAAALCRSISGVLRSHGNKSIEKNLTASEYEACQSDCCRERHSQKHGPVPWFCWMLRSRCSATRFKKFHCFLLEVNLEHMEQGALTDWKCWTLEVGQFVSMATGPQLKVSKWKFHVHWYHWFINWAERCWKWNWFKILEMIRLYQQTPFSLKAEGYFFLMKVVTFALHQRHLLIHLIRPLLLCLLRPCQYEYLPWHVAVQLTDEPGELRFWVPSRQLGGQLPSFSPEVFLSKCRN